MNTKIIGGTLLIVGTTIGGGMLALPVAAAPGGFIHSAILLFACWAVMTLSALLILEVNLWLPTGSNIISMAKVTLGESGAVVAWLSYLLLLYSLLSAYTSSGTDILHSLLLLIGIELPLEFNSMLFVGLLGFVVYKGIQSVDYANRGLMFGKLSAYALLVISLAPHVDNANFQGGKAVALLGGTTVMITSFGFATIIPSLRAYYQSDVVKLRRTILVGSFIPLICYVAWIYVFLGVVPLSGDTALNEAMRTTHTTTELTAALSRALQNPWITEFSRFFTSICVATSFLGVSLGLSDFLADGLKIEKQGKGNLIIYSITFLPPLAIIFFYPDAFIIGISNAGIFCMILLVFLPALMVWRGRYHKNIATGYRVRGGKLSLLMLMLVASVIIGLGLVSNFS